MRRSVTITLVAALGATLAISPQLSAAAVGGRVGPPDGVRLTVKVKR
jgi:hypothetical protein